MNATNNTVLNISKSPVKPRGIGAQKGRRNKSKIAGNNSETTAPDNGPLNSKEVCKLLKCHYQTLLYREKRGEIRPFLRIKGKKFYHRADVLLLMRVKPVISKPHYTQRRGGGPGSGIIIGPAIVVQQQPKKPTLWNRIIAFFAK